MNGMQRRTSSERLGAGFLPETLPHHAGETFSRTALTRFGTKMGLFQCENSNVSLL
jgi:hypothetical protein